MTIECPHCGYKDHYPAYEPTLVIKQGDCGSFFKSEGVLLTRIDNVYEGESAKVLGCPACLKVFINSK